MDSVFSYEETYHTFCEVLDRSDRKGRLEGEMKEGV